MRTLHKTNNSLRAPQPKAESQAIQAAENAHQADLYSNVSVADVKNKMQPRRFGDKVFRALSRLAFGRQIVDSVNTDLAMVEVIKDKQRAQSETTQPSQQDFFAVEKLTYPNGVIGGRQSAESVVPSAASQPAEAGHPVAPVSRQGALDRLPEPQQPDDGSQDWRQ